MHIIEGSSSWLSNFEVFQHLKQNKEHRKAGVRLAENVLTVEFEALDYFSKETDVSNQNEESIEGLLAYLHDVRLTKAEKLQITNLLPRSLVEFYLIVEECDERFKEEEVQAILDKISKLFPVSETLMQTE